MTIINDELLDLVSENDVVIRSELRSVIYAKKLKWIRGVSALIFNSQGQIWIPRRHPNKRLMPLYLDMSVSGHVSAGETYEQALFREAQEEINLDLALTLWERILYLKPQEHGSIAFSYVHAVYLDETPTFNKNEFIEAHWFYPEELITMIEQGEKTKSDLPIILKNLPKKFFSKHT